MNSDELSYFGGYLNKNCEVLIDGLGASEEQIKEVAKNSFKVSFLSEEKKREFICNIDLFL